MAEVGDSPEALQWHYETHGRKEGRMASDHDMEAKLRKLFNAEEYALFYPDVKDLYGEDEEALFQHYISYGLLEARRPCDKVSYEAAVALKNSVVDAMEKAGLSAVPGSVEIVAVIEGNTEMAAGSVQAAEALAQVTTVVEKAVTETVREAEKPASSSSSSSSSSSGSGNSSSAGSDSGKVPECAEDEHDWETIAKVDATCTATGTEAGKKCKICGKITGCAVIEKKNHTPVADEDVNRAATCGVAGVKDATKCSKCGTKLNSGTPIDATGEHTYEEGSNTCKNCGASK